MIPVDLDLSEIHLAISYGEHTKSRVCHIEWRGDSPFIRVPVELFSDELIETPTDVLAIGMSVFIADWHCVIVGRDWLSHMYLLQRLNHESASLEALFYCKERI